MKQQTIREAVNKERIKRGETINALAEQIFAAGIMSRCMVNLWLSGRNNVSDDKASKVMELMGFEVCLKDVFMDTMRLVISDEEPENTGAK